MKRKANRIDFKEVKRILNVIEIWKKEFKYMVNKMKINGIVEELIENPEKASEIIEKFKAENSEKLEIIRLNSIWIFDEGSIPENCTEIVLLYWILEEMTPYIAVELITGLILELRVDLAEKMADEYEYNSNPYFILELSIEELIDYLKV